MTYKDRSRLFRQAHRVARRTRKLVGDYMVAFKLALKNLWLQARFQSFEWGLIKKGLLFTEKSPIRKLSRMSRLFRGSLKKAMDFLDNYYFDIGMSLNDKKYLAFCVVFDEQKVDRWLGIK